ncbi:hypothetical protein F2Q68_00042648 [Brassica cretica]|uniref:mRNA-decapping enzyme-like protein n=2 Tax=Brassica cretica TaxID=69181 RepID=A0A8S9MEF0_BRACR|nr:hypothetical protein F2Q68_00042648 [Brassica cretica]
MSQNGKLIPPNMDQNSTRLLNLTVLQRIDPFIEEILITAAHVTFYEFNIEISQWSRKDVEGSLFVVKRVLPLRSIQIGSRDFHHIRSELRKMSQNGKLIPPNMDQNSTRLLNLTVLQRIDPFIEEILITAAHVTFYEFNIEISQWSRKDVEGSLFVVKRNKQQPRFQFIVMNRRSTDYLAHIPRQTRSQVRHLRKATPLQPHQPTIAPPAPLQSSSPIMSHFENNPDLISSNNSNVHTDLVTPSSFFAPPRTMTQPHLIPGSSTPTAPPLNFNDASHHQRQHGTPMLQPFPPPTPPPSLAPSHSVPVINRDKVKEALLKLVQLLLTGERIHRHGDPSFTKCTSTMKLSRVGQWEQWRFGVECVVKT